MKYLFKFKSYFLLFIDYFFKFLSFLFPEKFFLTLIMGKPGSGKSTYLALLVRERLQKGRIVYTTHHCLGARYLDPNWLGQFMLDDVDIIVDEGQLVWDNRNFKSFNDYIKFFISNFRHFKVNVFVLSQSFEDLDVKIRRQAHRIFILQPSFIPFTILLQKVRIKFGVNHDGTDIVTHYKTSIFDFRFKFAPVAYKFFDSYSKPNLPPIPFVRYWGNAPFLFTFKGTFNLFRNKIGSFHLKAKWNNRRVARREVSVMEHGSNKR